MYLKYSLSAYLPASDYLYMPTYASRLLPIIPDPYHTKCKCIKCKHNNDCDEGRKAIDLATI